jgi:hypothetical protein
MSSGLFGQLGVGVKRDKMVTEGGDGNERATYEK